MLLHAKPRKTRQAVTLSLTQPLNLSTSKPADKSHIHTYANLSQLVTFYVISRELHMGEAAHFQIFWFRVQSLFLQNP